MNVTFNGSGIEYLNPLNGATSSTSANGETLGTLGFNTYTGVTTIAAGTLSVTSLANYGSFSAIGSGSNVSNVAALVLGSAGQTGTLQYIGQNSGQFLSLTQTPSVVTNRLFTLAGNGALDSSGGYGGAGINAGTANNAVLWFNNSAGAIGFSTTGAKTLTLTGNSTGDNEIDIKLTNNTMDSSALSVTKTGIGTWDLGNSANTYTGPTTITSGVLRAVDGSSLPTASNLVFNGTNGTNAVFETSGTFNRAIGTGSNQVSWAANASGGFAAFGSPLTVNFGGQAIPTQVTWGAGGIGNGTGALILNSPTALSTVTIVNPINLGSSFATTRTIEVDDNTTTTTDYAIMSGALSGTASPGTMAITKTGAGVLELNGNSTFTGGGNATPNTGGVMISNGTLVINSFANGGALGALTGAGDIADRLILGQNTNNNTTALTYIGTGETVNRIIEIDGGGTTSIEADGSGPLVITAMTFPSTANKILNLRGDSADRNEITATLQNSPTLLLSTTTNATTTVTVNSGTVGLSVGAVVSGTNIAAGSTIAQIVDATHIIVLSTAATGTGTNNDPPDSGTLTAAEETFSVAACGCFRGNNTYTGGTTLSAGVLIINNNNAFGAGLITAGNVAIQERRRRM